MTKEMYLIKANLPTSKSNITSGNGEGMWVFVSEDCKKSYDNDGTGEYIGILDNDSFFFPAIKHGIDVDITLCGENRPIIYPADYGIQIDYLRELIEIPTFTGEQIKEKIKSILGKCGVEGDVEQAFLSDYDDDEFPIEIALHGLNQSGWGKSKHSLSDILNEQLEEWLLTKICNLNPELQEDKFEDSYAESMGEIVNELLQDIFDEKTYITRAEWKSMLIENKNKE